VHCPLQSVPQSVAQAIEKKADSSNNQIANPIRLICVPVGHFLIQFRDDWCAASWAMKSSSNCTLPNAQGHLGAIDNIGNRKWRRRRVPRGCVLRK
jgi:hypothetical protein